MVEEIKLIVNDLIYLLFVMEGEGEKVEVVLMLGSYCYFLDLLFKEIEDVYNLGINAIVLFFLVVEVKKDNVGIESYNLEGLI